MAEVLNFPPRETPESVAEDGWSAGKKAAFSMFLEAGLTPDEATRSAEVLVAEGRGYFAALERHGASKVDAMTEAITYLLARAKEMVWSVT